MSIARPIAKQLAAAISKSEPTEALYFDGARDILLPPGTFNVSAAQDYSFSAWVRMSASGSYPMVFSGNLQTELYFFEGTRKPTFNDGSASAKLYSTALTLNVWTHIACVRSGTTVHLYVDGVGESAAGNANARSGNAYIGSRAGSLYFIGYLKDLKFFLGTALSADNVTYLSSEGASGVDPGTPTNHWPLAGNAIDIVAGANGTIR